MKENKLGREDLLDQSELTDYDDDDGDGKGGDLVVGAKVTDDFEGVVVDLLGSHQVRVVCTDCLDTFMITSEQYVLIVSFVHSHKSPFDLVKKTLYMFSAFHGFCSKAFQPYLMKMT